MWYRESSEGALRDFTEAGVLERRKIALLSVHPMSGWGEVSANEWMAEWFICNSPARRKSDLPGQFRSAKGDSPLGAVAAALRTTSPSRETFANEWRCPRKDFARGGVVLGDAHWLAFSRPRQGIKIHGLAASDMPPKKNATRAL